VRPDYDQPANPTGAGQGSIADRRPWRLGLFCAMGIPLALLEREKSHKGHAIETSLLQ